MAWVALGGYLVYLALAFGLRTWLQIRATGSSGFKGIRGRPGSAEHTAGALFVVALVLGASGPVLALTDVAPAIAALDTTLAHSLGVVLFVAGLASTFAAQVAMGSSSRIGVDQSERTDLVTTGRFSVVRNPIFAAMLPTSLGLVLMVPSAVTLVAIAALVLALELQVRIVEEPYLLRAHGHTYSAYASRVARFVPGIGLLRPSGPAHEAR